MTKKILITTIALLLAGCFSYSKYSRELDIYLATRYVGQPVDEFFYKYKVPAGEFVLDDGSRIYRWTSIQPASSALDVHSRTYVAPGSKYEIVDSVSDVVETQYCEIRIYTDKDGIIQRFHIVVDTAGKFSASRCSEIFNDTVLGVLPKPPATQAGQN